MKKIPLTQNQEAIVDDADFEWLSQWKWSATWDKHTKSYYATGSIKIDGKRTPARMHRLILGLANGEKLQGHHKNHNTLDNRRENLQRITNKENHWSQKNRRGYRWREDVGKFQAHIRVDGKTKSLGYYLTTEEAQAAYRQAKDIYHKITIIGNE